MNVTVEPGVLLYWRVKVCSHDMVTDYLQCVAHNNFNLCPLVCINAVVFFVRDQLDTKLLPTRISYMILWD